MLFPMLVKVPVPGLVGVPPPKSRPSRPTKLAGFEFGIPIDWPNAPTLESHAVPVLFTTWFHPKRRSFTRFGEMDQVQSPTVLQMGDSTVPFPSSSCELVEGST